MLNSRTKMANNVAHVLFFMLIGYSANWVKGHGMLMEPPSRVSLWRDQRFQAIATEKGLQEYTDNQYNCGGYWNQHGKNGGKCGICGDKYQGPRKSEFPGKFAQGIITGSYEAGQVIRIVVKVTANHGGSFEFRLCPHNDLNTEATQSCLNKNVLQMADGSGSRYTVLPGWGDQTINVRLPHDVTCTRCVLQWKYITASNWGTDPVTGKSGKGYGPQEQFYACADVKISDGDGGNGGNSGDEGDGGDGGDGGAPPPCRGSGSLSTSDEVAKQCVLACNNGCCPPQLCNDACRT